MRRYPQYTLFFILIWATVFAVNAQTFPVQEDTYAKIIDDGFGISTESLGDRTTIRFGNGLAYAFVKFDLSDYEGSVEDITSVHYNAYAVLKWDELINTSSMQLYEITDDSWTESELTGENYPTIGSLISNITISSADHLTLHSIDITDYVKSQLENDPNKIISFAFTHGPEIPWVRYSSKDEISGNPIPTLELSSMASNTPNPPTAFSASNVSVSSFIATWENTNNTDFYKLDVATDPNFTSILSDYNDKTIAANFHTVTGLSAGQTYYYRVRAVNSAGASSNSNTISTTTELTIAEAPIATQASSISSSSFIANWSSVDIAESYQLDLATDPNFTNSVAGYQNISSNNNSMIISNLSPNSTYYYRVRSVNIAGISQNSNVISVTTSFSTSSTTLTKSTVSVFPNPVSDQLKISTNKVGEFQIEIFSPSGKVIHKKTYIISQANAIIEIPIFALPIGIYHLTIRHGDDFITKKIVIFME